MDEQLKKLLSGYAAGYEAVRDQPHMRRTRAVYEELFALAEKSDGLSVFQRDAERLRMAARITAEPVYDTYSLQREKHDPNETPLRDREESVMRAASSSRSPDELAYLVELEMARAKKEIARDSFFQYLVVSLANRLFSYNIGKANARVSPRDYLGPFIMVREEIAKSYRYMEHAFGLGWDAITGTPRYLKWLLNFQPLSADTTRVYSALDPGNLEWMREALFEEILSDKSAAGILMRVSDHVFNPSPDETEAKAARAKTVAAAWDHIKKYPWADREKLQNADY
ncbi:MAG: hypothetical protein EPN93_07550 [Spirochaetes bacterium]|nr:MAG: hypothetical protein EPN93_07550 [Spirochaetota bacterium]